MALYAQSDVARSHLGKAVRASSRQVAQAWPKRNVGRARWRDLVILVILVIAARGSLEDDPQVVLVPRLGPGVGDDLVPPGDLVSERAKVGQDPFDGLSYVRRGREAGGEYLREGAATLLGIAVGDEVRMGEAGIEHR